MIYIPALWKDKPVKPVITVWAEENGTLEPGKYEWSFGNGLKNSHTGYTVLAKGRVIRAGLSVKDRDGTAAVTITVNKEDSGYLVIKQDGRYSGVEIFDIPLEVDVGDILNFKTLASSGNRGNIESGIVSVLIELDL
jgi:hypothetical protein